MYVWVSGRNGPTKLINRHSNNKWKHVYGLPSNIACFLKKDIYDGDLYVLAISTLLICREFHEMLFLFLE